jgi:hypothetical protein
MRGYEFRWTQKKRLRGWAVNGTGSESCPVAGFGIGGVEPSGSAARELVN